MTARTGRRARFDIYPGFSGQWRWRLRAANGRIVADSGESYTRLRDAERAVMGALRATAQAAKRLVEARP